MAKSRSRKKPKATAVFARHETLHPRFGWAQEGLNDLAMEDPGIFLRDDAPVLLRGWEKHGLRSIRYWCNAFKVLTEEDRQSKPTIFGQKLLDADGWDPFLETRPASGYSIGICLKNPAQLLPGPTPLASFNPLSLTRRPCWMNCGTMPADWADGLPIPPLKKDVSCILRMYAEQESKKGPTEDSIDCPFTELRLLFSAGDGRRYEFQIGPKETLPAEIIVAACLEFASISQNLSSTMGISRLAHMLGSPGRVFKLPESAIAEAIEKVSQSNDNLFISDSAGLQQLQYDGDPLEMSEDILDEYFAAQRVAV